MTDVEQVAVTAADREAYLELNTMMPQFADDIRAGKWDRLTSLQVIARHRIASQEQAATAIETLRAENLEARREVLSLIESIWKAEFRNEAPEWEPLPDLVGMITQLDNMYAGVRSQRDQARAELADTKARLGEAVYLLECCSSESHSYESEGMARDAANAFLAKQEPKP